MLEIKYSGTINTAVVTNVFTSVKMWSKKFQTKYTQNALKYPHVLIRTPDKTIYGKLNVNADTSHHYVVTF